MDPIALLQEWLEAAAVPHLTRIANDYNQWVASGGYPAKVVLRDTSYPYPTHTVTRLSARVIYLEGGSNCQRADVREVTS